jgi:glycerol kinase
MVLRLTTMPNVENASRLVAAQSSAVRTLDGRAIHVQHVRIRPAEGDAQAALLEALCHGQGVLDGLPLQFLRTAWCGPV